MVRVLKTQLLIPVSKTYVMFNIPDCPEEIKECLANYDVSKLIVSMNPGVNLEYKGTTKEFPPKGQRGSEADERTSVSNEYHVWEVFHKNRTLLLEGILKDYNGGTWIIHNICGFLTGDKGKIADDILEYTLDGYGFIVKEFLKEN